MRRILLFWLPVLMVWHAPAAGADSTSEDVPVSSSIAAFAESLGLPPVTYRATFAADLARLVYGPDVKAGQVVAALRARARERRDDDADMVSVPVPLSAEVWSRAVFRRTVTRDTLMSAIVMDRRAALVCRGLAALDDETLSFLADHPSLLGDLHDHLASQFAAFASSLRVHGGRVATPGGASSESLWESVVGARVENPERFIRALFSASEGRIAYLYDTVAGLDQPHQAFVVGAWMSDDRRRRESFAALADAIAGGYREWSAIERPFVRPVSDFAIVMTRLRVDPSGAPAAPADRAFWSSVFDMAGPSTAEPGHARDERQLIDAAFLADATGVSDMYVRGDRVDQLSFGQRVFASVGADGRQDAIAALKAMSRQRMLLLSLERIGITRPAVYAAVSRKAKEATGGDPNRAFWTLVQLQGSLAIIVRLQMVGTIDAATSERLVLSLAAVPVEDDRYRGGVARWFDRDLLPVLPRGDGAEARLILGLSGPTNDPSNPRVAWEGQTYRLDFGAAEARRLRAVREKQGGLSIDLGLDLSRLAQGRPASPEGSLAQALASLAERFPPRSKNALVDTMAPGVSPPDAPRERINRAIGELQKVDDRRDSERANRIVSGLVDTADALFGEAIVSIVYAMDIGQSDGPALLASNVALRHDFGFSLHEGELRARRPWDVPRQDFLPEEPWHVTGALLGLDIALAPMSLKRIDFDHLVAAPRLRSTEREAFSVGVALLDRRRLRDADRVAIVAAIARGRARVAALASNAEGVDQIADALRLDGWRRRALAWTLEHRSSDVTSLFSSAELLTLGGGTAGVDLDAWGTSGFLSSGCACTHMMLPGSWRLFEGRPQLAFMSFVVSDLNLRVAALLDELRLPASLERPVLEAAVQDFIDDAAPSDANDWLALAQTAQSLTRQRVEDYVAAAAAVDGPLVPLDDNGAGGAL